MEPRKINPWKLARYGVAGWLPGGRKQCIFCGHRVWRFMPYRAGSRSSPPLMRVLDMVGSDADHFECPRCGAHDRERHLLLYLQASGLLPSMHGHDVLHFAPERHLSERIAAIKPSRYTKCDLYPQSPDLVQVDIQAIPFDAETFDFVIANHVLEHVDDDLKALTEICRVLKIGGYAILQTPYSRKLHHTWQDRGITDQPSRLQAFGQEDHVRLFGRDIFERFATAGLTSKVSQHSDLLPQVDPAREGINPAEPFFLFQRAPATD